MSWHATGRNYGRVLLYALPQWRGLLAIVVLTLGYSGLAALQPWPLKLLVDYGIGGATPPGVVTEWLSEATIPIGIAFILAAAAASLGLYFLTAALDAALTMLWSVAGQRMVYGLATDLFLRLQRLSLLFHSRRSVGDSLSRITSDAWSVYKLADGILVTPARHLITFASVGAVAWQLDPELATLMLTVTPALVASAAYFGKRLKQTANSSREAVTQLTTFVHECLRSMPLVQVFSAEAANRGKFSELSLRAVRSNRAAAWVGNSYGLINGVMTTIAVAVVTFAGGMRVLEQQITLGTLLVFIAYVRLLEGAARGLLNNYGSLRTAEVGVERVVEVLQSHDAVRDSSTARPLPKRSLSPTGEIVFDKVSFGYDAERPVLRELSLCVAAGETLALVGATGAGKSTVVSLVPRFFDPWEGTVRLDGYDLRDLQLSSLRSEIALVLQEPFILPISVADNIAYGRPDATREEIVAAAIVANADEFIKRLPHGYDTVIGENGATLSGGQQQRLSIARAVLKDPRVLILDEPTAALDTVSEQLVMSALGRLMHGRTSIIIAHRLSTVRRADRIAVMDRGQIIEIGTHDELLARAGRYARMHSLHTLTGRERVA